VEVAVHGEVDAAHVAELAAAARRLTGLADVVRWGLAQAPPQVIAEVIVQDEYTHDVVIAWAGGAFVVFDTT
jgi:hypothetical protein